MLPTHFFDHAKVRVLAVQEVPGLGTGGENGPTPKGEDQEEGPESRTAMPMPDYSSSSSSKPRSSTRGPLSSSFATMAATEFS